MNERLFEGKYKILSTLGQGGMSTVFLAENIKLGTLWAIKEIRKESGARCDLFIEPNILKKLSHPALPRIFDILEDDSSIYIIEDYIEGNSLEKLLQNNGKFPEHTVVGWAKQLCDVLGYLHSFRPNPIIYRDMKPSNIILTRDGAIKLIDFGIAREYKIDAGSDTVYIGTRGYAAPEQYGFGQTGIATDIYSLGITLFHLITGISPCNPSFEMKPLRYFDKNLSAGMERIIDRCTRYKPNERYSSVRELLADFESMEKTNAGDFCNNTNSSILAAEDIKLDNRNLKNIVTFKKLILNIWGNAEFACELAYTAASLTTLNVLLIDLDTLNATADEYLNVSKYPANIRSFEEMVNNSGFNICMDAADKKVLTREIFLEACVQKTRNLYVLTGNYNLSNFEYYSEASLAIVIEKAYELFDLVILITNSFIYDAFTLFAIRRCDCNIIPVRADKIAVREVNRYLVHLKEKQNIALDKSRFVAFEYNPSIHLGKDILNELTEGSFIGAIGCSERRQAYRNLKAIYARNMERKIRSDYIRILARFNIVPRRTIMDAVREDFFMSIRKIKKTIKLRRKP